MKKQHIILNKDSVSYHECADKLLQVRLVQLLIPEANLTCYTWTVAVSTDHRDADEI